MRYLPRYKHCFVCGDENPVGLNIVFETDEKKVYARFRSDERYLGYQDRIHGGIVCAVMDETMGWACSVITKRFYYTMELTVKFKKPLPPNTTVIVEASMVDIKHSIAIAKAKLSDEDGNVFAVSSGKYFPVAEREMEAIVKLLHHHPEDGKPVTLKDI